MIGLVLVTHGRLAEELLLVLQHVVGPVPAAVPICIAPDDDMELRRQDILAAIAGTDAGQGVVVLTDLFGGTPSNLALSAMQPGRVEVVAGMNLPMLVKLTRLRDLPVQEAAMMAAEAGRKYISVASSLLATGPNTLVPPGGRG